MPNLPFPSSRFRIVDLDDVSYAVFDNRSDAEAYMNNMRLDQPDLPVDNYCIKEETVLG